MDSSPEPSPKQDSEVEVSDQEESQKGGSGDERRSASGSDDEEQVVQQKAQRKRNISDSEDEQQSSPAKRNNSGSDSEQEQRQSSPPRRRNSGSEKSDSQDKQDSDGGKQEQRSSTKKDIFGSDSGSEDDENESEKPERAAVSRSPSVEGEGSDNEDRERSPIRESQGYDDEDGVMREADEEERDKPPPEIRIDIELPRVMANLGDKEEMHFVKFPNFLSVDTHPYDPSWYEDEIDDDEHKDEEGKKRLKLKVENTIRWKSVPDEQGHVNRESNARIAKWSDGSMTLHLGSEIFDVHKNELLHGENNHLFVRQGLGLQGQAVFRTKLSFRPHSTDSFTHRKMTLSLADKSSKTNKIRVLPNVGLDPEARRSEMVKKEEDKLKASIRRENKQRRTRERAIHRGPSAAYLEPDYEEEDEDGGISLSAIKSNYKSRVQDQGYGRTYSPEDSGDDSDFDLGKVKSEKKKARIVESDDED